MAVIVALVVLLAFGTLLLEAVGIVLGMVWLAVSFCLDISAARRLRRRWQQREEEEEQARFSEHRRPYDEQRSRENLAYWQQRLSEQ
ncbi:MULTISPECIES: hypothetical protein [Eikenella]|uniref:Uncharacterized protein n=2 Tax=Eikenella TaxID=538 RepID=A0A1B6VVG6_9NEIS|nr:MULTISPECIES: hypothetical protein [Eikenella]MBH5329159.1 hypothetical protein [Eikenella glucosivorans]OAM37490.1 hypothetical protein A7Q00_11225 [Eikenella halliae]